VTDTQDNHARTDDTAVLAAFDHEPMAAHGLLGAGEGAADERDDSLATELAKAAPKKWWNRGTLVLGGVALVLAGFLGGLQVQKHYGTSATAASGTRAGAGGFGGTGRGAGAYGFPGGAAQGGAGAPGGAASSAAAAAGTTGTVKLVDGDTIYVQTSAGDLVTVKTGKSTTVKTATTGTLKDVKAGDSVTVQGAAATDGTVTATSVTADGKK
jgi:hypothetical protein